MDCEVDRVQLHAEKRDSLHRVEFALFPVNLKPKSAEVLEGEDLILIWLAPRTRSRETACVEWEARDMKVRILQVDRCKPVGGTDALKYAFLSKHPERELVKGPVQNAQVPDWS